MPSRVVDCREDQSKREIRRRIARLRRRVDRRLQSTRREAGRLTHWRTHAARWPGPAISTAFGVGLALAAGLSGRRVMRRLAALLVREGLGRIGAGLWREWSRAWAASAQTHPTAGEETPRV
ncbi:MAG: hypothetical protein JW809_03620 [Pirellulales bacterium]|nr:hypothetical protein [Pirellulales bacterium]